MTHDSQLQQINNIFTVRSQQQKGYVEFLFILGRFLGYIFVWELLQKLSVYVQHNINTRVIFLTFNHALVAPIYCLRFIISFQVSGCKVHLPWRSLIESLFIWVSLGE